MVEEAGVRMVVAADVVRCPRLNFSCARIRGALRPQDGSHAKAGVSRSSKEQGDYGHRSPECKGTGEWNSCERRGSGRESDPGRECD